MEHYTDHTDENAIRAKAHELWVQRGCPEGSPEVDWAAAERLLRTPTRQQAAAPPAPQEAVDARSEAARPEGRAKRRDFY